MSPLWIIYDFVTIMLEPRFNVLYCHPQGEWFGLHVCACANIEEALAYPPRHFTCNVVMLVIIYPGP